MNKHYHDHTESSIFELCGSLIETKLNLGPISEWKDADYLILSAAISDETRVYLSINTLKRIFGRISTDKPYCPQIATLEALAIFLGFSSWKEVSKNYIDIQARKNEEVKPGRIGLRIDKSSNRAMLIVATVLVSILLLFTLFKSQLSGPDVSLLCQNPDGKLMHSAVFRLYAQRKTMDTNTYLVDFNDRSKVAVKLNNPIFTHYYQTPGWYQTILSLRGDPIDTVIVKIKSHGWFAYISGPIDVYGRMPIKSFNGRVDGMTGLKKNDVIALGGDTLKPYFLTYVNIKETNINGDNFELKSKLKIGSDIKDRDCIGIRFSIYGESDDHYIGITNPECIAWSDAEFSENVSTGLWKDLRTLGRNLNPMVNIRLTAINKRVALYWNGKIIYRTYYKKSLGSVAGVKIQFDGLGEIYSFKLSDINTGETF